MGRIRSFRVRVSFKGFMAGIKRGSGGLVWGRLKDGISVSVEVVRGVILWN